MEVPADHAHRHSVEFPLQPGRPVLSGGTGAIGPHLPAHSRRPATTDSCPRSTAPSPSPFTTLSRARRRHGGQRTSGERSRWACSTAAAPLEVDARRGLRRDPGYAAEQVRSSRPAVTDAESAVRRLPRTRCTTARRCGGPWTRPRSRGCCRPTPTQESRWRRSSTPRPSASPATTSSSACPGRPETCSTRRNRRASAPCDDPAGGWVRRHADYSTTAEDLVPLPSGGVFAEAVLGRSNSAEKLDITRFWNWQDSPIPLPAPDIAAVQAGSRAQQDDTTTPSGLRRPGSRVQQPAGAPRPRGALRGSSARSRTAASSAT